MSTMISLSLHLPAKDVARAVDFFTRIGFSPNPKLDTKGSTCLVISEDILLFLHTESDFRAITKKSISESATSAEAVMQLRAESRQRVDRIVDTALASGGRPIHEPVDQGWLYGRSFLDLDDHNWDVFWVDSKRAPVQV